MKLSAIAMTMLLALAGCKKDGSAVVKDDASIEQAEAVPQEEATTQDALECIAPSQIESISFQSECKVPKAWDADSCGTLFLIDGKTRNYSARSGCPTTGKKAVKYLESCSVSYQPAMGYHCWYDVKNGVVTGIQQLGPGEIETPIVE